MIKHIVRQLCIVIFLLSHFAHGQNHISIPNFEEFNKYWECDTTFEESEDLPWEGLPDTVDGVWYLNITDSPIKFSCTFDIFTNNLCEITELKIEIKYASYLIAANLFPIEGLDEYYPIVVSEDATQWSTTAMQTIISTSNKISIAGIVLPTGYFVFDEITIDHNGKSEGECQPTTITTDTTTTDIPTSDTTETPEIETQPTTESPSTTTAVPTTVQTTTEPIETAEPEPTEGQTSTITVTDSTTDSITDSPTDSITDSPTDSITDSTTDSITDSTTDSITDSTTDSVTDSTTEIITESTTDSITDSTTEIITDSTTEIITESTTHSVTVSSTELNTDSTTELSTDETTVTGSDTPSSTGTSAFTTRSTSTSNTPIPTGTIPTSTSASTRSPLPNPSTKGDGLSTTDIILYIVLPSVAVLAVISTGFAIAVFGKGCFNGVGSAGNRNISGLNPHHTLQGPPAVPQPNYYPTSIPVSNTMPHHVSLNVQGLDIPRAHVDPGSSASSYGRSPPSQGGPRLPDYQGYNDDTTNYLPKIRRRGEF